jgi:hypothetical protein
MFENKNLLFFVINIFRRFCWAGLVYSFTGLVLVFIQHGTYVENLNTYVIGFLICVIWLLIVSGLKGNIYENNKLD